MNLCCYLKAESSRFSIVMPRRMKLLSNVDHKMKIHSKRSYHPVYIGFNKSKGHNTEIISNFMKKTERRSRKDSYIDKQRNFN